MFTRVEKLISFRNLKPKKKEGFLKVISAFSFLGISLGVAILIIVMSVMNGFHTDLTNKILGLNPHLVIESNGKKIFIAAVHGSAAGIGSTLALACDFLLMCENSKLSFVFSNIGLIPDGGAHWSLSQKLGYNKALEFIINGEHVSASECEKLGLANKIFKENNFMNEVESWAKKLAKRSPLVAKETKELLRYSMNSDYWSTFNKEIKIQANLAKTDDFKNAVKAFFNKEKPKFSGK